MQLGTKPTRHWEYPTYTAILPSHAGEHCLELSGVVQDYPFLPSIVLSGDFAVFCDEPGKMRLAPLPTEVFWGDLTTQGLLIRDTTAGHKVSIKLYGSSDDNVMTIRQIKLDSGGYNYGVICTISQKYSGNYSISRISPGIINCAQDASPITDMTLADKQLNMGANGITIKDGNNTRTFNAANGASYAQDSLKWGGYQIAVSGTPTAGSGTIYFV